MLFSFPPTVLLGIAFSLIFLSATVATDEKRHLEPGNGVLGPQGTCDLEGLEGLEILGDPLAYPTTASIAASAACAAATYLDTPPACLNGALDTGALGQSAFGCWANGGFGSYPVVFQNYRDSKVTATTSWTSKSGADVQLDALNKEAWCFVTDSGATEATEKGIINGFETDLAGTNRLERFSYDYFVRSCPTTDTPCGNQFYLNIYMRKPGSTQFYDCRLDFLPPDTNGEPLKKYNFQVDLNTKAGSFKGNCDGADSLQTAYNKGFVLSSSACYIWQLNVGDTSLRENLGGCYDNVQLTTATGLSVYDFQIKPPTPAPTPMPTPAPTPAPTKAPTKAPTPSPSKAPSKKGDKTKAPTPATTKAPSNKGGGKGDRRLEW